MDIQEIKQNKKELRTHLERITGKLWMVTFGVKGFECISEQLTLNVVGHDLADAVLECEEQLRNRGWIE